MKFYKSIEFPFYYGLLEENKAVLIQVHEKGSIISHNMEFNHDCAIDTSLVECTKEEFNKAYQEAYTYINALAIEFNKNNEFIRNESLKSEGY